MLVISAETGSRETGFWSPTFKLTSEMVSFSITATRLDVAAPAVEVLSNGR